MKSNIFVPEKIKVGFQNRSDTYTKKLAYVIYYDQKGKLRKEASWQSWRDKDIEDIDFTNEPTSGFVLNKKVGDYVSDWNHRQAYVRIYDSRDFEFEITIENLLYILENANSIKGKGLEGEFVYGWDGKELILIPTSSPDYNEIAQYNKIIHEKSHVKSKDLVVGGTYRAKDNQEWIYMGRFDYHTTKWNRENNEFEDVNKGKHYYFAQNTKDYYSKLPALHLMELKSLGDKFIGVVSEECVEEYADMFDKLERNKAYSPYDKTKDEYVVYELDTFLKNMTGDWYYRYKSIYLATDANSSATIQRYYGDSNTYKVVVQEKYQDKSFWGNGRIHYKDKTIFEGTLEQIYNTYKPKYKNEYLENGKLYKKGDE